MAVVTEVKIGFFKPSGFEDTHWVRTGNRGAAAGIALQKYAGNAAACLNYITTNHRSSDSVPQGAVLLDAGPDVGL